MKTSRPKRRIWITICMLLLGVALIGVGLSKKQEKSVLAKAARICMECVGIG